MTDSVISGATALSIPSPSTRSPRPRPRIVGPPARRIKWSRPFRPPLPDAGSGKDYYYTLQPSYTVAGLVNERGVPVEAYTYDAYGKVNMFDVGFHGDPPRQSDDGPAASVPDRLATIHESVKQTG